MSQLPGPIITKDLRLIIPGAKSGRRLLDYYIRNRSLLKEWEPLRSSDFYTLKYHKASLSKDVVNAKNGTAYRFLITKNSFEKENKIIGILAFTGIVKGPFLSSFAGYSMDGDFQNKGYMTQALKSGIDFMFGTVCLHRIEANIMPRNRASLKVVEKLDFINEGTSPKYLKINGKWEDHIHMVLRNRELE